MFSLLKNLFNREGNMEASNSGKVTITVYKDTYRPTLAWEKLKVKQTVLSAQSLDPNTPISDDKVRFVCISDTHSQIEKLKTEFVPNGDVLIHAGDFTKIGKPQEVLEFNEYLGKLPHKQKIVIAGNHDLSFDDNLMESHQDYLKNQFFLDTNDVKKFLEGKGVKHVKELMTNCTYLEDDFVELYGIKIYGSPWQPEFGGWGFNLPRGEECLEKWNQIPDEVDILITHGPPIGHGDSCFDKQKAGCVELLSTVQKRVKPKYHVFGHIHEDYGMTSDGVTNYINASSCTLRYKCTQPPIVFDFPIPPGHSKEEVMGKIISCKRNPSETTKKEKDDDSIVFKEDTEDCAE